MLEALSFLQSMFIGILTWCRDAVFWVLGLIVDLLREFLLVLAPLLPAMPEKSAVDLLPLTNILTTANYFIPVAEGLSIAVVWVLVYGSIGGYKIIKLIRGGG